jgi:hypothetical protein
VIFWGAESSFIDGFEVSFHLMKLLALLLSLPAFGFLFYCAAYQTSIIAMNLTTNEDVNYGILRYPFFWGNI